MELIDGFSMGRVLRRSVDRNVRIPLPVLARIAMDAASGLDYAHRLEDRDGRPLHLVHRDVSLDNILVSFAGHVKLVDFGIAKAATSESRAPVTRVGVVKGKVGYI